MAPRGNSPCRAKGESGCLVDEIANLVEPIE
jgi:hypothetical protein